MAYDYEKMPNVSGKHATMIGGVQGLSRGMVEGLLENGYKIVSVDIQKEKLEAACEGYRAMGYEAYEICGNLSGRVDVNRIFMETMEILDGKPDMLIPATDVQRRHLPEEFPTEEWDLVLNINLSTMSLVTQKALKVMLKQAAGGKIITIGSMVIWFGRTTVPAYTASKGAVSQLTKSLVVDYAGCNININCIYPGYMDTEMYADMTREQKGECTVRIPTGR